MSINIINNIINKRALNQKCNNFIFTGLSDEKISEIIANINGYLEIENYYDIKDFNYCPQLIVNKIFDLKTESLKDIFIQTLRLLKISENISFLDRKSIIRFISVLRQYNIGIQFIFYNCNFLSLTEQKLLNDIYSFTSYLLSIIILTNNQQEIKTFLNSHNEMLDSREDYNVFDYCQLK